MPPGDARGWPASGTTPGGFDDHTHNLECHYEHTCDELK